MKIYFKSRFIVYVYVVIIIMIVNIIVYTSGEALNNVDLFYLNGLFLISSITLFIIDYLRFNHSVNKFFKNYKVNGKIDLGLLSNNGEGQIVEEIIEFLAAQHEKDISKYNQSLEEIEEYMSKWVHEIKIPISVSSMIADQLEEKDKEELLYELERIKHYVTQALYISRANHYNHDLFIEKISLESTINEVVKNYKTFFIQKNIGIEIVGDNLSEKYIYTDKQWFIYIIGQILHNSTKYIKMSGSITIEVLENENEIVVSITDNGIGIQQNELNRIFNKGYVGSNGRLHTKATGMGLYLSKKMATILSISIHVESEQGKYTKMSLVIPKFTNDIELLRHR